MPSGIIYTLSFAVPSPKRMDLQIPREAPDLSKERLLRTAWKKVCT